MLSNRIPSLVLGLRFGDGCSLHFLSWFTILCVFIQRREEGEHSKMETRHKNAFISRERERLKAVASVPWACLQEASSNLLTSRWLPGTFSMMG